MKIDGGCHCGQIRYEAEIDPEKVMICHCTDCQTLSGSAYRTVAPALAGTFKLLSGKPREYVKTSERGVKRVQTFCQNCGTPIYSGPADADSSFFGIRAGTVRQRNELRPSAQYWCRSAQAWVNELGSIKATE